MMKRLLFVIILFTCLLCNNVFAIEIGDLFVFGKFYYYPEDTHLYPLVWTVVDKQENELLLMTKNIIAEKQFNKFSGPTNWENCSLRKWLNTDFYNMAFNKEEQQQILCKTIINTNSNPIYGTKGCKNTEDKVFIFSLDEIVKYFGERNSLRKTIGTPYAIANGLWVSHMSRMSEGYSVWWLRTPGKANSFSTLVHAAGEPGRAGDHSCTNGNGVRPCIWIKYQQISKNK